MDTQLSKITSQTMSSLEDEIYNATIGGAVYCKDIVGKVKIGKSFRPKDRLNSHRSAYGYGDSFVSDCYVNYSDIEVAVHKLLSMKRLHGEVFDVSIDIAKNTINYVCNDIGVKADCFGRNLRKLTLEQVDNVFNCLNKEKNKEDGEYSVIHSFDMDWWDMVINDGIDSVKECLMIVEVITGNSFDVCINKFKNMGDVLDSFTDNQISFYKKLQLMTTALVTASLSFDDRKKNLKLQFNEMHKQLMIEELHRLSA